MDSLNCEAVILNRGEFLLRGEFKFPTEEYNDDETMRIVFY